MGPEMTDRIADSALYRHLWGTDEARAVLGEEGRLRGWLEVIVTLARVQAEAGLIPANAARLIAEHARTERIDLDYAAAQTRQASHSMLGLIRALQAALPEDEQKQVYADYQGLNETPGVTPGLPMGLAENATTVRVEGGKTLTTDGPFVGMKEAVGGYFIIEADDLDAAIEVAARVPAARYGGAVEIRPSEVYW